METAIQQRKHRPLGALETAVELLLLDGGSDRPNDLVFQIDLKVTIPRKVRFINMVGRSRLLRLTDIRKAFVLLHLDKEELVANESIGELEKRKRFYPWGERERGATYQILTAILIQQMVE